MQIKDIPDQVIFDACDAFHAALKRRDRTAQTPEVSLADKYPPKLIMAKMDKMSDQHKIEYGVSLRTAWVVRPYVPDPED